jgi:4-hydroxy-2-oxoheptanedioate aldolase
MERKGKRQTPLPFVTIVRLADRREPAPPTTEELSMLSLGRRCGFVLAAAAIVFASTGAGSGQQPAAPAAPGPRLNRVIELFEQGKPALGTFVQNFAVRTAMSVARSGLDYILIDMEHAPYDVAQLQVFLMAMTDKQAIMRKGNLQPDVVPMVRIPQYGREQLGFIVKQVLDVGVFGIMFPHIDTAEQARTAVSVSRYPQKKGAPDAEPIGHRGNAPTNAVWYWGVRNYAELADTWPLDKQGELLLAMQIESPEAVNNIDSILAVPGIGAIFIGPNDLSYNLGNFGNADTPEEEAALDKVLQACKKKNVPVGLTAYSPELVTKRLKQGFTFIAIGQDIGITAPIDATLKAARAFKQGS